VDVLPQTVPDVIVPQPSSSGTIVKAPPRQTTGPVVVSPQPSSPSRPIINVPRQQASPIVVLPQPSSPSGPIINLPRERQIVRPSIRQRDRNYWSPADNQGYYYYPIDAYGHNRRWVRRFPWMTQFISSLYPRWYMYDNWEPYYTIDPRVRVQPNGMIPPNAYIYDRSFPILPQLPTFEEAGIDIRPLMIAKTESMLGGTERAVIQATLDQIDQKLVDLRSLPLYREKILEGYMIVPDLDTGRFTWIRRG
jgi:hypothetical protein